MRASSDQLLLTEVVPRVVARLPAILTEVRELLADRHPDYAEFVVDELDEIVDAATGFFERLVELADPARSPTEYEGTFHIERALFEEIGREHCRQGRDVAGLLGAYRAGAAVAWRHVADEALRAGVSAEVFAALAAALFAAVDQLSAATLRGHVEEQSAATFARQRLREELAELLLSDRSDMAVVRAAAARAKWTLPQTAAVVLVDRDAEAEQQLLARLDDSCLLLRHADALVGVLPDPDGPAKRSRLRTGLDGTGAVVGPGVSLDRLPRSMHLAELAVRLRREGILHDDPLFIDEHLDAIIVHHDDHLLAALRARYLAPLAGLPDATRDRLAETLRSWLMHLGNRKAVADDLHIHPQTVRYRLGRLRELFGPALDDPNTRAALLLALAWGGPAATGTDGGAE